MDSSDLQYVLYAVWMSLLTAFFKEIVGNDTVAMIGSYNLTVVEPVIVLQIVALFKLSRRRSVINDILVWVVFAIAVIYFMTFVRSIEDGLFGAVRQLRGQLAFVLYLLIFAYLPREERLLNAMRNALIVSAIMLAVLVFLRLRFGATLFIVTKFTEVTEINDGGRPLSADGALMLGMGVVMLASLVIERGVSFFARMGYLLGPVLLIALMFSAQATANISTYLALGVLVTLHPSPDRTLRIVVVLAVTMLVLLVLGYLSGAFGRVDLSMLPKYFQTNLLKRTGTFEVRHIIWDGLMRDYPRWSLEERLFGLEITDKPTIFMPRSGGYYWWASIHSMYYGSLVFMGAVGLVLYLLMVSLIGLRGLRRAFGPRWTWNSFGGAIPLALLAAFSLFGYSYELRDEHTVLILVALVASRPVLNAAKQSVRSGFYPVRLTGNSLGVRPHG